MGRNLRRPDRQVRRTLDGDVYGRRAVRLTPGRKPEPARSLLAARGLHAAPDLCGLLTLVLCEMTRQANSHTISGNPPAPPSIPGRIFRLLRVAGAPPPRAGRVSMCMRFRRGCR